MIDEKLSKTLIFKEDEGQKGGSLFKESLYKRCF